MSWSTINSSERMAPRPSPDLSSLSIDTNMLKNDSGATGISAYGAVFAFEVSTDVRRDRFFPVVAAGIISTLPSSPTLLDATPSEKKDPRPIAGTQTSTVTYFTADQTTATQSDVTICLHHPSSMTHPSAERHLACQMTVSSATRLDTTVGVTESSEYSATHQVVLYMPTPTAQATLLVPTTHVKMTHTAHTATKFNDPRFNDPRFFPHFSHPPYNITRQHN